MMEYTKVPFTPYYELSMTEYNMVRNLSGFVFEKDCMQICFGKTIVHPIWDDEFLQLKIFNSGLEMEAYVCIEEAQRLLGIEIKHLSQEYLSYLIVRELSYHGIHFQKIHSKLDEKLILVEASLVIKDVGDVQLLIDTKKFSIDEDFLFKKRNSLPGYIRFISEWTPFVTYLSPSEINNLSDQDIVFVYSK